MPDPIGDFDSYLGTVLLAELLSEGDASRLERRLVHDDRIAIAQSSYVGLFGDPFDVRDATLLTTQVHHPAGVPAERVLAAVHEEVARIATDGVGADELRRVQARTEAQLLRQADSVLGRTLGFAAAELVHGRAELAGELAARLAAVTPDQVQAAARDLDPDTAAVLELRATGGRTMTAALDLSLVPPLGEPRPQPVPAAEETTLPSGLRVVVVPRPGVPLIELRLRVPFAAPTAPTPAGTPPGRRCSPARCCSGTATHDQTGIAELLQGHGAELSVSTDPDRLLFATTLLPDGLAPVLGLLAELLTGATYPDDPVEGERDRVAERIAIARSQPGVIARTALAARRYGEHPYAITLPDPELVAAVDGTALRAAAPRAGAARRQQPGPGRRPRPAAPPTDAVAGALAGWSASGAAVEAPPAPRAARAGHRAGRPAGRRAVQPPPRRPGPARTDPDLAAVRLANMIFGGYFSSRLVENIRERRGYTYSPRSSVDHQAAGSSFLVEADVATEVTGPALLETWYELGRMALAAGHRGRARRRPPLHPRQHGAVHRHPRRPRQHALGPGRRGTAGRLARRAPARPRRGDRRGGPGGLPPLPGADRAHRRRRR